MLTWRCETAVVAGAGAAGHVLGSGDVVGPVALLHDAHLADVEPMRAVREALEGVGASAHAVTAGDDGADAVAAMAADLPASVQTIVALGGGSVLDVAKLVRLTLVDPAVAVHTLRRPGRSGAIVVRGVRGRGPRLVAMPTTIGTGSEVSPVACFGDGGKRLAIGPPLQPDLAVLDPDLTATLAPAQVRIGLVEITLRLLGPFVAGAAALPAADRAACRALEAMAPHLRPAAIDAPARIDAALVSAGTRMDLSLAGRGPYAGKLWYLSTALADVAPLGKVDANLLVLPVVVDRILAGDRRFGEAGRVHEAWRSLGGIGPPTGDTLARLLAGRPPRPAPSFSVGAAAAQAGLRWGRGLPMLAGLDDDDLVAFYRAAGSGPPEVERSGPALRVDARA